MADDNVADVVSQASQQNQNLSGFMSQILGSMGASAAASRTEEDVQNRSAADQRIVTQQQGEGELTAQNNTRAAATSLGTNMDDPAQVITSLGAQLTDAYAKADAASAKVADIASSSPIKAALIAHASATGKIGANLLAGFLTGGATGTVAAQKERISLLSGQIKDINADTQTIAKTQSDIAPVKSAASISAATDLAANAFTVAAAQTAQRAAQLNISGVQAVAGMSQEQLSNSINVENLQLGVAQKQLNQEALRLTIEERADRIQRNEETEAGLTAYAGYVQQGLSALNPNAPEAKLPPQKIVQLIKTDPELFKDAARIGLQQSLTGQLVINTDPGQAATIIQQSGAQLAPAQINLRNLLSRALGDAHAGKVTGINGIAVADPAHPVNTKDKVEVQQVTGINAIQAAKHDAAAIPFANNANIYQAPNLNTIASAAAIQNDPFFKAVVSPQLASGAKVGTDPEALVGQAVAAVQQKQMSFQEAVNGISLIFKTAASLNNAMVQYSSVGLPDQTGYNTPVRDSVGRTSTLDLSDSTKVTRYLSSRLLKNNAIGIIGQNMPSYQVQGNK